MAVFPYAIRLLGRCKSVVFSVGFTTNQVFTTLYAVFTTQTALDFYHTLALLWSVLPQNRRGSGRFTTPAHALLPHVLPAFYHTGRSTFAPMFRPMTCMGAWGKQHERRLVAGMISGWWGMETHGNGMSAGWTMLVDPRADRGDDHL